MEKQLFKWLELDVAADYLQFYDYFSGDTLQRDNNIVFSKLIYFFANYMPDLQKLSLRSTPVTIQLAELIQV